MKITNIRREHMPESSEAVRLAATVSHGTSDVKHEECWFEFPVALHDEISLTGDPWLVCFLPVAMTLGESLEIQAPVDSKLFRSMMEVMGIWKTWYPQLSKVPLIVKQEDRSRIQVADRGGAFFSGGVDSFFTLLWNKEHGDHQIDELLSVWGFDIPIGKEAEFAAHTKRLEKVANYVGTPLVTITTNLRKTVFSEAAWGELSFGCALATVGLLLEPRYNSIVAANDNTYLDLLPWGGHPLTFQKFSTSNLEFVYHGGEITRVQKTEYVVKFPICLDHLHVCWKEASDKNCCNCNKCYRTMAVLEVLGRLHEARTFDAGKFTLKKLGRVLSMNEPSQRFFLQVQAFADTMGRVDIVRAVRRSLRYSRMLLRFLPLVRTIKKRYCFTLGDALERLLKRGTID